jgi:hypothetical protein
VAAEASGHVRIHSHSGNVWEGNVEGSRGTPLRPLSDSELIAKFQSNCGASPLAEELANIVLNLATQPNLDRLHELASVIANQEVQPA